VKKPTRSPCGVFGSLGSEIVFGNAGVGGV